MLYLIQWGGDWSDESELWTKYPEVATQMKAVIKDKSNIIWMSFEDLLYIFHSINICMIKHPKVNK